MANSVYGINKGINKPIEFKGLKAQYIWYLGGCFLVLLILFSILYILGVNNFLCLGIVGVAGTIAVIRTYGLSNKYGTHGMMKKVARRYIPHVLKCHSRKLFKTSNNGKKS